METAEKHNIASDILRERYKYCRDEVMYRIDTRYKLLKSLILIISFSFVAIYQLKWNFFPLVTIFLINTFSIILFAESMHIRILSDYMIRIEKILDNRYQINVYGWERESRSVKHNKLKISTLLAVSALVFAILLNFVFAYQAAEWLSTNYTNLCLAPQCMILNCKFQFMFLLLAPIVIFAIYAYKSQIEKWIRKKR